MKFTSEEMPRKLFEVSCFVFMGRRSKRTPRTMILSEQVIRSPRMT